MLACTFVFSVQISAAELSPDSISIGVLAYNGKQQALARWKPTAEYLAQHIHSHSFEIVPLTHEEFIHAINKGQLEFILTNPGHYITLEVKFGVTRIFLHAKNKSTAKVIRALACRVWGKA
jgi:ABC-type phosphate/phosphonate transport system substrate-binding protein